MKRFRPLFLLLCLVACEPYEPSKPIITEEGSSGQSIRPRARANHNQPNNDISNSFISLSDVLSLIDKDSLLTRCSQFQDVSVEPYVDPIDSDTLMYIVNYPGSSGWKVFSSDSRTPAILAEGRTGYFDLNDSDGAVAAWMSGVAADMKRIRHSPDKDLAFSELDIKCHKAYWTRLDPFIIDDDPPVNPPAHWEVSYTSVTEVFDSVAHMTPQWSQQTPYNQFCPYYSSGPQGRAYAGCVAVAGAHVLYYLHNHLGIPGSMVSQATYSSNDNEWSFSSPSTSIWSLMDTTSHASESFSNRPEAIMIGYIGKTINMHYGSSYSWALPANLRTELFNPAGISCSHGDYNETVVSSSLLNLMPVIITASDQLIPVNGRIHTFVADGYLRTRIKYIEHHHWVGPKPSPEGYDDYTTYSYSSPVVSSIKFNWGWWTQWYHGMINGTLHGPLNEGWFSLTGGWTVTSSTVDEYDYNHNRQMIYGFSVTE